MRHPPPLSPSQQWLVSLAPSATSPSLHRIVWPAARESTCTRYMKSTGGRVIARVETPYPLARYVSLTPSEWSYCHLANCWFYLLPEGARSGVYIVDHHCPTPGTSPDDEGLLFEVPA